MQVPVQIDFQGGDASEALRSQIQSRIEELERRYGRITAGRVVVKLPGGHHRHGHYSVHVHLALPEGRQIDIDRTPDADGRFCDPSFAINDAFNRARRRLQDQARRMQGEVKLHEDVPVATVSRLDPSGTFGFLTTADGSEIYFHNHSLVHTAMQDLTVGSRVSYVEALGEQGPQASTVRILGKHKLRL